MTREEIMAMGAGRELDFLIAVNIKKLESYSSKQSWVNLGTQHSQFWNEAVQYPAYWSVEHKEALSVPNYSTDISAAWEVKNAIKTMGLKARIVFSKELQLMFRAAGTHELAAWPSALFLLEPIHICKAALLAVIES